MSLSQYALACLLTLLPGPPGVKYEDAYIQLYPVDPAKCPHHDLSSEITFLLYTRHNPLVSQSLRIGDDRLLENSHMNFSKPTIMFYHAFFENSDSVSSNMVRQAYNIRGDHNVILVTSTRLSAGPWYPTAVRNTWVIGLYSAQFINYLYDKGLNPRLLHLVGLSLGAQGAGVAGGAARWRPARITGLDPALPLFPGLPLSHRLDRSDAHFVDIIHTDAGIFGISAPMGHADFYVNGGKSPQPGCELKAVIPRKMLLEKFFCSHWRSYQLYTQSVLNPWAYPGMLCDPNNNKSCELQKGSKKIYAYMGYGADPRARGKFYVKTSADSPYMSH